MVFCAHCGKELPEPVTDFCPYCGKSTKLPPIEATITSPPSSVAATQTRSSSWNLKIILIAVVSLIVVFGGMFAFSRYWESQHTQFTLSDEVQSLSNRGYKCENVNWSNYLNLVQSSSYNVVVKSVDIQGLENTIGLSKITPTFFYDSSSIWTPINDGTTLTIYKCSF